MLTTDVGREPAAHLGAQTCWSAAGVVSATTAVGVVAALVARGSPAAATVALALVAAAGAAVVDVRERRIPNRLVSVAAVPSVAFVAVAMLSGGGRAVAVPSVVGAALLAGPILIVHLVDPAAMGFGDVKLAAVLGATVGLMDWRWALVALCLASGGTSAVGLARRARDLPFAPGLVAASACTMAVHAAMGGVSLTWR